MKKLFVVNFRYETIFRNNTKISCLFLAKGSPTTRKLQMLNNEFREFYLPQKPANTNIGTLSVQELFFQLIGRLGVELGVSRVGMVYFMG